MEASRSNILQTRAQLRRLRHRRRMAPLQGRLTRRKHRKKSLLRLVKKKSNRTCYLETLWLTEKMIVQFAENPAAEREGVCPQLMEKEHTV